MSAKNPYKKGGMFEGASHLIFEKAKELRKKMTDTEMILWNYIKPGLSNYKFRRQHPIGLYIADFYCHRAKLIIEVDGKIHDQDDVKRLDEERQKDLERWGYRVIRFTNKEVQLDIQKVIGAIKTTILEIINSQKINAASAEGV